MRLTPLRWKRLRQPSTVRCMLLDLILSISRDCMNTLYWHYMYANTHP